MIPFPNKKYQIIYADPPWSYEDKMSGHGFSLDHEYKTQDIEWIKALPIQDITEKNCVLFLWVVSPQLQEGLDVIRSWGFKYKTIAFVWNKKTKCGKDVSNLGRWTMGNIELCLLSIKGKPNSWRIDKSIKQLVKAVRTKHSAKPSEVRNRIVKLFGEKTRIELFARKPKGQLFEDSSFKGWDVWGDEV